MQTRRDIFNQDGRQSTGHDGTHGELEEMLSGWHHDPGLDMAACLLGG
jgi:hypothetical protein